MKKLIYPKTNEDKISVEDGLKALNDIVMTIEAELKKKGQTSNPVFNSESSFDLILSLNTEFEKSGFSLKSKNNKRDLDYDGLEQFKKILFYGVYEELIKKFNINSIDIISKKKKEHTIKLIQYINEKRIHKEEQPFKLSGEIDIIKYAIIDKCNDDDNICEINLFGDPRYVIQFDDKDIIMPLIDYLYPSNDDQTNETSPP